ncbi:Malonyl CoA-acyl carrier protein transacylase [Paraconexibacter sp. AEG42_29]|uniref:Malonyl CoA-acyl carrier protein transacylase n=1 Tax=Paraconexibacter sp. AEG42_29 TaxID=2997339 RepID=A0AAU7B0Y4_9ACTN
MNDAATRTAVLFPGQGSHVEGMGDTVARAAPELHARCLELVGDDAFARAGEDTRFAQPAIFCASLAAAAHDGVDGDAIYAGHSLGEISALTAAGVFTLDDGLRLVVERGRLMAQSAADQGDGTMFALLKGTAEQAHEIAGAHGVTVANDNAPGQLVLSGSRAKLEEAQAAAKEVGIRVMRLDVAGAFHSPAMASAADGFAAALADIELHEARVPVFSCASAKPFADVRAELAAALTSPVLWRQTLLALQDAGVTDFVDAGPAQILAGTVKRTIAVAANA